MAAVEEWTLKESDSLPEEEIATTADIVVAEETLLEGRIVVAEERPGAAEKRNDVAMWDSIFLVLI